VVRRHLEQASERGEPGVASVDETLEAWSSVLDIDPTEQRLFCSPAGSLEKSDEVLFGWLVLTPTQVMFLPLQEPDEDRTGVFIAPIDSICRADREPQDQLVILTDGVGRSFLVSDSSGGADAFWANSSSPERILVWDRLSPLIDDHLHGQCRYVQITAGDDVVAELEPGLLMKQDEGVGVLAPSFLARSIPIGDMVTVEIGHPAVVYQFDSEVMGWETPNNDESELDLRGTVVLQVGAPKALRVYNRRESFRAETERVVQASRLTRDDEARWITVGDPFTGTVLDFSIGGCRFQSTTMLNPGDRVQLMLPLADKPLTLRAQCLRRIEAEEDTSGCIYGLEFQGLSIAQEDRIHRSVMILERTKPRGEDVTEAPEEAALPSELQVALTFLQSQPRDIRARFSEKVLSLIDD